MISSNKNAIIGIASDGQTLPSGLKGEMFRHGVIIAFSDLAEVTMKTILAHFTGKVAVITVDREKGTGNDRNDILFQPF